MNQEEKHQEETRRDALLSYSVRRGFRSRFISLVVEQIRRFQARTFEESHSYAETKQEQFKRPSTSVTLYLKLYAGQINSILIFFHDLITSEELRTMASYWHEIISKCRDLETELSRYSKSILQSDLESANQNVKLTEEELKQLLDFINNFPAMLFSQGDSQQSIIDTVNKIQEKIQDILGHSKKTGVLQAELLFVGDMKNILNTVQSLSQTAVEEQGFNTLPIERPTLSTEVNHVIQDTFHESVDENEVLDTGTHRSKDSNKLKDGENTYYEHPKQNPKTPNAKTQSRQAQKDIKGTRNLNAQHRNIKHKGLHINQRDQWATGAYLGRPSATEIAECVVILDYVRFSDYPEVSKNVQLWCKTTSSLSDDHTQTRQQNAGAKATQMNMYMDIKRGHT
ncbi:hypothetical protein FSP39_005146 [Pinctada imbricata]|uniref:Uncharacterized protein n=1 Tax=Pinctada imbricata TaxID=66713 RepID=A0AA89C4V8_PINIB|nr:hypothetical protein FSP39_005146 [Pinctada imbricata]